MKVHVQWCVDRSDLRYKSNTYLKEEIIEIFKAEELIDLLLRYKISEGVLKDYHFIKNQLYISYTLVSSNEMFERDLKV